MLNIELKECYHTRDCRYQWDEASMNYDPVYIVSCQFSLLRCERFPPPPVVPVCNLTKQQEVGLVHGYSIPQNVAQLPVLRLLVRELLPRPISLISF